MELTLECYLQDEGLREELERRAHRMRAEEMHRYFAQAAHALNVRTPREAEACHSYASR